MNQQQAVVNADRTPCGLRLTLQVVEARDHHTPHLYFISDQVSHRRGPAFLGRQEFPDADQSTVSYPP